MAAETWDFDTVHSSIGFSIRHLVVSKVRGKFTKWSGKLSIDEKDPAANSIEVTIEVASIDTHEPARDTHLRSGDFFEAEKFPQLTFKSTKIEKSSDGYSVTGDLTMRGATHPVTLAVEDGGRVKDPWGKTRAGFVATGSLDRKQWGVSFNQTLDQGGVALSDKVELVIEIEATKALEVAVVSLPPRPLSASGKGPGRRAY